MIVAAASAIWIAVVEPGAEPGFDRTVLQSTSPRDGVVQGAFIASARGGRNGPVAEPATYGWSVAEATTAGALEARAAAEPRAKRLREGSHRKEK